MPRHGSRLESVCSWLIRIPAFQKQNFGKPDVTPKVGDVGVHPKSTLRLQALEEIR